LNTPIVERSFSLTSHSRIARIIVAIFFTFILMACKGNPPISPTLTSNSDGNNYPSYKLDLDLSKVVLRPEDVSDLFQDATYSITQGIESSVSKGETVTYPTQVLAHTTAFAFGFSTRIEIFSTVDQAISSYDTSMAQQTGKTLDMNIVGEGSKAFSRPALSAEGFNLDSTEYAVIFRESNAVSIIILRTDRSVSPTRLSELADLVINRLQP
jgi:hypothetical protein